MKLLSFLATATYCLSVAANDYEDARVVPNVLSEDSIAELVGHVRLLRDVENAHDAGKNRVHGKAAVHPDDIRRVLRSLGDETEVWTEDPINVRSTLLTGNTDPHKDAKSNGNEFEDDEDVVIVFLNDNDEAFFQVGEDQIPVIAGTMVSFKGNKMDHNTVVPGGSVQLLGPFASRELEGCAASCSTDLSCNGACFNEVSAGSCPTKVLDYLFHVHKTCGEHVDLGEYCEGGEECGDNALDNCGLNFHGYEIPFDVYQRVECCGAVDAVEE